jgi:hypothetical protein
MYTGLTTFSAAVNSSVVVIDNTDFGDKGKLIVIKEVIIGSGPMQLII